MTAVEKLNSNAVVAIVVIYVVLLILAYYYSDVYGRRIVDIVSAVLIWRGTWGLIDFSETAMGLSYGLGSNTAFLLGGVLLVIFIDPLLSNV